MLYFIVNPNAGGVNGYKVWKRLERRLVRKKTEYQVVLTGGRGEARLIAAELTEKDPGDEEIILAGVGGDGTMMISRGDCICRGDREPVLTGSCPPGKCGRSITASWITGTTYLGTAGSW